MILDIYKDSFEYAGQDIITLLKLGLLSFFSFLIIPEIFVLGYQYKVINSGINGMIGGDDKLPEFNNFKKMFIDGLKFFVVQLIYILVPVLVFLGIALLGNYYQNGILGAIAIIVGVILFIVSSLYLFLAIPNMINNEGSLKAAFDFKRLNEIIKMIGIGKYIGFDIGLILITTIISAVVAVILIVVLGLFGLAAIAFVPSAFGFITIGWGIIYVAIFSFIINPYLGIFANRACGLIYGVGA